MSISPRYNPPFNITGVSDYILDPAGGRGVYLLGYDGALFAFGVTACRGMNGLAAFEGRTAARLLNPTSAQRAVGKLVVIEDTAAETYACPPS